MSIKIISALPGFSLVANDLPEDFKVVNDINDINEKNMEMKIKRNIQFSNLPIEFVAKSKHRKNNNSKRPKPRKKKR